MFELRWSVFNKIALDFRPATLPKKKRTYWNEKRPETTWNHPETTWKHLEPAVY